MALTEQDIERIADAVVRKQIEHPPTCVSFSRRQAASLAGLADALETGRRITFATVVGAVVIAILSALWLGFVGKAGLAK